MTAVAVAEAEEPEATTQRPSRRHVLQAMSGLLVAMLVAISSSTIVANALPTIIRELDGSQGHYTWIVAALLMTSTASTPIWGKFADLFSKRTLLEIALGIFVLSSVLAGLAQSPGELIAWRAVQGIGLGGVQALAQIIIAAIVSPRERGRYSGYFGAVIAAGTIGGPLTGGLIVGTPWLGWRWCFFVSLPLALASWLLLRRTLRLPVTKRKVHIDYAGAALITGGTSALLIWVTLAGHQFAWLSAPSVIMAAAGLAALAIAVWVETRVPEPIVPLRLFTDRTVVLAIIASTTVGVAMFSTPMLVGQYFQIGRGFSPIHAGLLTLPMVMGQVAASTTAGQLISRFGRWKRFLVLGTVLMTIGLGLASTTSAATPVWLICTYLVFFGMGIGMTLQNLVLAVQNTVNPADMGSGSSSVAFFRSLGGAVGVSILGAVVAAKVAAQLGSTEIDGAGAAMQAAYGDAIGSTFLISAIMVGIAAVAAFLIREVPLHTTIRVAQD